MTVTGPDVHFPAGAQPRSFGSFFYEQQLGLTRAKAGPPHAVVFDTRPVSFAVRDLQPRRRSRADAATRPGSWAWLHATDAQGLYDALVATGTPIVSAPVDGPFGRTFTFADPDGYPITIHDRA